MSNLEREEKYQDYFEGSHDAIMTLEPPSWKFTSGNPQTLKMFGAKNEEEFLSFGPVDLSPERQPDGRVSAEKAKEMIEVAVREGSHFFEWKHRRIGGEEFQADVLLTKVVREGKVIVLATVREITGHKRMQEALAASEVRYRRLFESAKDGILILDAETGVVLDVNAFLIQLLGFSHEQFLGKAIWELGFFKDIVANQAHFAELQQKGYIRYDDRPLETMDGRRIDVEFVSNLYMVNDSEVIQCNIRDITERKRTEGLLQESQAQFRSIFENVAIGLYRTTPDGRILMANPALLQMLGYASTEELQRRDLEKEGFEPGYSRELFKERLEREGSIIGMESAWTRSDGTRLWLRESARVVRDETGKILYYEGTVEDTSERKRTEEAHTRLTTAVEQAVEAIVITDANGTIQYVNPAFQKTTGYTCEEAIGQNPRILKSGKHDAEFYSRMWSVLKRGEVWSGHLINKHKDGTLYEEDVTISPVRDTAGKTVNYVAVKRDVTREGELENRLRQAQKMEIVGQLAGGVAHDFNNILMAVSGYCELLLIKMPQDDPMRRDVLEILRAQKQGASLTHQLLAFSRKQVLEPKIFDLRVVVSNMESLLQRLIGEDIDLRILTRPDVGLVEADANQMEQVIMNLAVNSRDAMPRGGQLTIEISNEELDEEYARLHLDAKPGPYVLLSLTDTGHGMDQETLSHIFEPFFTTKGAEKGTGLGLATVYGIVTQSRGSISVYSEPGQGTTFRIHLPRVGDAGKGVTSERADSAPTGGSETILLVDDNESIRSSVGELMKIHGYNVLLAGDGKEALEVSRNHAGPIDLLVTDVVMREMSGREMAQQISAERTGIKVLFMSGFTDDAVLRHGILSSDSAFIQKPVPMANLLHKIRELLD